MRSPKVTRSQTSGTRETLTVHVCSENKVPNHGFILFYICDARNVIKDTND